MKKVFLGSLSCLMISAMAMAQGGFHLGVKGGANMGKVDGKSFNDEYKLGYALGAFAEIDFNKSIGIQPEVIFNQTNSKTSTEFGDIYNDIPGGNIKLNYLSIPVLLRINSGKLLTFHIGPQFSILTSSNKTLVQNGSDAFSKGDFSMLGGAQINLGTFRVYGRYNIGLKNINDIDNQDKWKNQQIQLGVGIKIL